MLVQQMIAATATGVVFTADPITGDRDRTVLTAVLGLGESLVSGNALGEQWAVTGGRPEMTRPDPDRPVPPKTFPMPRPTTKAAAREGIPAARLTALCAQSSSPRLTQNSPLLLATSGTLTANAPCPGPSSVCCARTLWQTITPVIPDRVAIPYYQQ